MPTPTTFPPSGLDRATGLMGLPGTPQPANSIKQVIATVDTVPGTFFEEMPDSPQFDFGEQGTVRHTFECDWAITFQNLIPLIQRGQIFLDSFQNYSKIINTTVHYMPGNRCHIEITAEGLNWGIPPDEFSIEPMEINPDIFKHPRYNYGPGGANLASGYGLTAQEKGLIRWTLAQNSITAYDAYQNIFSSNGAQMAGGNVDWTNGVVGNTIPKRMAWEIIQKSWRGEDTFYLPALVVTYSSFYYNPVQVCPGGFIDDPTNSIFGPSIPYFFWSRNGTNDHASNNNILQAPEGRLNNLFSNGVTYLRKCDSVTYQRTWFKLTQTWVGAPTGPSDGTSTYIYWDPDLYAIPTTPIGPLPNPKTMM